MKIISRWLLNALIIYISPYLLSDVVVSSFLNAIAAALTIGLLNVILKPLLVLLTLPINILTLGLFTFIINASMILLASRIISNFQVLSFWHAIILSLILSIFNSWFNRK